MEIEQVLFPSNFLNCRIQLLGGCFKRVHTIRQLDPTQSDPTKLDRVNRPLHINFLIAWFLPMSI